jgi:hypothetical protein
LAPAIIARKPARNTKRSPNARKKSSTDVSIAPLPLRRKWTIPLALSRPVGDPAAKKAPKAITCTTVVTIPAVPVHSRIARPSQLVCEPDYEPPGE